MITFLYTLSVFLAPTLFFVGPGARIAALTIWAVTYAVHCLRDMPPFTDTTQRKG